MRERARDVEHAARVHVQSKRVEQALEVEEIVKQIAHSRSSRITRRHEIHENTKLTKATISCLSRNVLRGFRGFVFFVAWWPLACYSVCARFSSSSIRPRPIA